MIKIMDASSFDIVKTFECGQCFRWDAVTDTQSTDKQSVYIGVAMGKAARLWCKNDSVFISCSAEDYEAVWRDYFDIDRDYGAIFREIASVDPFMEKAVEFGRGIRIIRQDKWEALCSFIISQNNNIPRIKKIIASLCKKFGDEIKFEEKTFHTFPPASRIAELTAEELASIRCGYRAEYIIAAAKAVVSGGINLEALAQKTASESRAALKKICGVGDKVADCVLLFGLHMLDVFPRDVWINRAIKQIYGSDFDPGIFGPYAGIAQQCIFFYYRSFGQ